MGKKKIVRVYVDGVTIARCKRTRDLIHSLNEHPDYEIRPGPYGDHDSSFRPDVIINAHSEEFDFHKNGKPFVTYGEYRREVIELKNPKGLANRVHRELGGVE